MSDSVDRFAALEEQIAALQARIAALEARIPHDAQSLVTSQHDLVTTISMHGQPLRQDEADESTVQGTLMYAGFARIAGQPYQIQRQQLVAPLFDLAPDALAHVFAALASPHRIIILRLLCQGPRTSQQLQELLGMSSAGQLYHHLKELLAAGLIVQRGRSHYGVDPAKVITICIALMVAAHFVRAELAEEPPVDEQAEGHKPSG